jgi:hypothetical protein
LSSSEYDNIPSRFIFNKDVSRHGYWSDKTKVRIYDTRDFEFEIDVSNMMYILMHSDISKRDIMEECVLGWNGKHVVLIPVNSDVYRDYIVHTEKTKNKPFSLKSLIHGHTYATKWHGDAVYVGYHEWSMPGNFSVMESLGKRHIFCVASGRFEPLNANEINYETSSDVVNNYADLVDKLNRHPYLKKAIKINHKKGFIQDPNNQNVFYAFCKYDGIEAIRFSFLNNRLTINEYEMKYKQVDGNLEFTVKKDKDYRVASLHHKYFNHFDEALAELTRLGFGTMSYVNLDGKTIDFPTDMLI